MKELIRASSEKIEVGLKCRMLWDENGETLRKNPKNPVIAYPIVLLAVPRLEFGAPLG